MPLISSDVIPGREQGRRRVAMFVMTSAAFQALFCAGSLHSFRVKEGIPEGAVFVGAEYSNSHKALLAYFEHEDFDPVWEITSGVPEYPIVLEHRSD